MKRMFGRSKILIWVPAVYCTVLSGIKVFSPENSGDAAFYAFLPLCFFFVAASHLSLLKRIDELEACSDVLKE